MLQNRELIIGTNHELHWNVTSYNFHSIISPTPAGRNALGQTLYISEKTPNSQTRWPTVKAGFCVTDTIIAYQELFWESFLVYFIWAVLQTAAAFQLMKMYSLYQAVSTNTTNTPASQNQGDLEELSLQYQEPIQVRDGLQENGMLYDGAFGCYTLPLLHSHCCSRNLLLRSSSFKLIKVTWARPVSEGIAVGKKKSVLMMRTQGIVERHGCLTWGGPNSINGSSVHRNDPEVQTYF